MTQRALRFTPPKALPTASPNGLLVAIALAVSLCAGIATPGVAHAQSTELTSGRKGAVALGILGAELGAVIPAAAGADADSWWAFLVFPTLGAAGGAVAGHFLLDQNNRAKASVGLLTAGLALAVPALVLTLHLASYDPEDDDWAEVRRRRQRARAGTGALRLGEAGISGGLPGVAILDSYTPEQRQRFGLPAQREVHLSLVTGAF